VDLFDELKSAQTKTGGVCTVCAWIESLSPEDQAKWDKAFAEHNSVYTTSSLYNVAKKHGATWGYEGGGRHRRLRHRQ
jgi:hypothetical protein